MNIKNISKLNRKEPKMYRFWFKTALFCTFFYACATTGPQSQERNPYYAMLLPQSGVAQTMSLMFAQGFPDSKAAFNNVYALETKFIGQNRLGGKPFPRYLLRADEGGMRYFADAFGTAFLTLPADGFNSVLFSAFIRPLALEINAPQQAAAYLQEVESLFFNRRVFESKEQVAAEFADPQNCLNSIAALLFASRRNGLYDVSYLAGDSRRLYQVNAQVSPEGLLLAYNAWPLPLGKEGALY